MTTFSFEVDNESDVAKLRIILKAFKVKKLKIEKKIKKQAKAS